MKLREHPLLIHGGLPSWPPVWVSADSNTNRVIAGAEVGILKKVQRWSLAEKNLFLYIEHEQCAYLGRITVEDEIFCQRLFDFLTACRGRSIRAIGDMETGDLLSNS